MPTRRTNDFHKDSKLLCCGTYRKALFWSSTFESAACLLTLKAHVQNRKMDEMGNSRHWHTFQSTLWDWLQRTKRCRGRNDRFSIFRLLSQNLHRSLQQNAKVNPEEAVLSWMMQMRDLHWLLQFFFEDQLWESVNLESTVKQMQHCQPIRGSWESPQVLQPNWAKFHRWILWFLCWNSQRSCFSHCDLAAAKWNQRKFFWESYSLAFSSMIQG